MIGSDNFFFSSKGVRIVKKSFALQTHSVWKSPKKVSFLRQQVSSDFGRNNLKIFTCSLLRSQWCKMELKTFFRWSGNCFLFGFEEETQPYKMTFVMSAMAHRIWMSNDQFWRKIPLVLQEVVAKMQVLMNGQQRQHKRLFCLHQRTVVENPTKCLIWTVKIEEFGANIQITLLSTHVRMYLASFWDFLSEFQTLWWQSWSWKKKLDFCNCIISNAQIQGISTC